MQLTVELRKHLIAWPTESRSNRSGRVIKASMNNARVAFGGTLCYIWTLPSGNSLIEEKGIN
jgi:hypothetical protein